MLNYCIVGCSQTGFSRQELKVPWKDIPVPEGWGRCNARYLCVCVGGGGGGWGGTRRQGVHVHSCVNSANMNSESLTKIFAVYRLFS